MALFRHFLLLLLLLYGAQGVIVWDALTASEEPIGKFRDTIKAAGLESFLKSSTCSNGQCYSVFAPTDDAMDRKFPSGTSGLDLNKFIKSYICGLENQEKNAIKVQATAFTNTKVNKFGQEINFGSGAKIEKYILLKCVDQSSLFWAKKVNGSVTTYYVNNAMIKPNSETVGNEDTFFVITDVIEPLPDTRSAYDYMKSKSEFSTFLEIYEKFKNLPNSNYDPAKKFTITSSYESDSKTSSIFIPENSGFSAIPSEKLTALKNNATAMAALLSSHVAFDQVVFISWMRNKPPINLKMGQSELVVPSKMYSERNGTSNYISCGGVTASIKSEGQPLKNAVFYQISQPLNYLYTDVTTMLNEKSPTFASACLTNTKCKAVLESGNVTVFAPRPGIALPIMNATLLEKFLLLHILPNTHLSTPEMRQGRVVTIANVGQIRFQPGGNDQVSVYGRFFYKVGRYGYDQGFVGGPLQEQNLPGKGGIVHVLQSSYLGNTTKSIYQLLEERFAIFSVLIGYLETFDLTENLKKVPASGRHYTFFAPTNAAFAKMTDNIGKRILTDVTLRNQLLKRLLVLNVVVVSGLDPNKGYSMVTALPYVNRPSEHATLVIRTSINREKLVVYLMPQEARVFDEAATASFLPSESEWGAVNGIVYALDAVPYNAKTAERVCKPGTACRGHSLTASRAGVLVVTIATIATRLLH